MTLFDTTAGSLPGRAKGGAVEEHLPRLEGEQHGALTLQGVGPVGQRLTGQHQRVLDLLTQLVGEFPADKRVPGDVQAGLVVSVLRGRLAGSALAHQMIEPPQQVHHVVHRAGRAVTEPLLQGATPLAGRTGAPLLVALLPVHDGVDELPEAAQLLLSAAQLGLLDEPLDGAEHGAVAGLQRHLHVWHAGDAGTAQSQTEAGLRGAPLGRVRRPTPTLTARRRHLARTQTDGHVTYRWQTVTSRQRSAAGPHRTPHWGDVTSQSYNSVMIEL